MITKYSILKLYSAHDLPEEVYKKFISKSEYNSSLITFYVNDSQKPVEIIDATKCTYLDYLLLEPITDNPIIKDEILSGIRYIIQEKDCIISDWLRNNGAELHEEVLIRA